MKTKSFLLIISILLASSSFIFAQAKSVPSYGVSTMVVKGDDSKEVNSEMVFLDEVLLLKSDKTGQNIKEFKYSEITGAEYSYSKKPMWKTGIVAGIFFGPLAAPFFFIRKKTHWITIAANNDFAVVKMESKNFRQIISELNIRKIKVESVIEK